MEKYNVEFARNDLQTLEQFTKLNDDDVQRLIKDPQDRQKMKTGINEMKDFQFYYSATSSLLKEFGMEKYAQLFMMHGIPSSLDLLLDLTDDKLQDLGIHDPSNRLRILKVIDEIRHNSLSSRLFPPFFFLSFPLLSIRKQREKKLKEERRDDVASRTSEWIKVFVNNETTSTSTSISISILFSFSFSVVFISG